MLFLLRFVAFVALLSGANAFHNKAALRKALCEVCAGEGTHANLDVSTIDLDGITDLSFLLSPQTNTEEGYYYYEAEGFSVWTEEEGDVLPCVAFETCNDKLSGIGLWNTAAVEDLKATFFNAYKFNQPLNGWKTGAVTTLVMTFAGAEEFDQPLNGWDTAAVETLEQTFWNAYKFNQPLNGWKTGAVESLSETFWNAYKFNQPLKCWNVAQVKIMDYAFENTESFNQKLCWDPPTVNHMKPSTEGMFDGSLFVGSADDCDRSLAEDCGWAENIANCWSGEPLGDMKACGEYIYPNTIGGGGGGFLGAKDAIAATSNAIAANVASCNLVKAIVSCGSPISPQCKNWATALCKVHKTNDDKCDADCSGAFSIKTGILATTALALLTSVVGLSF